MISADAVARAIVAACKETGEDPIRAASGLVGGVYGPTVRARHYALHALLEVYPALKTSEAARLVGAPGKPGYFYNNSWNQVARPTGERRKAIWWKEDAYRRVISAIGAPSSVRSAAKPPQRVARPPGLAPAPAPAPEREGRGSLASPLDKFAIDKRPAYLAGGDDQIASRAREQRACRDLLAEAAANTAKLQAQLPPEPEDDAGTGN